ncbi:MAG: ParB/RepB/Spo0J family partition protein [bacterium]
MSNKQRQVAVEQRISIEYIPIELIDEPEWNPNEEDPATFNLLVKNITEVGVKEPVLVCPRLEKGMEGRYLSVSGSHRVKAAKVAGKIEVPCIVEWSFDEDMQKFQNMRFNLIKGKIDPLKFTRMFDQLSSKYGDDVTRQMMAFIDKAAFESLYMSVKSSLPDDMKGALDNAKKEIKTIDGLAAVLNEMFSKYGGTVQKSYMIFSFGGQTHLWIIMDEANKQIADRMKRTAIETGKDINEVFRELMGNPSVESVSPVRQMEKESEKIVKDGSLVRT